MFYNPVSRLSSSSKQHLSMKIQFNISGISFAYREIFKEQGEEWRTDPI
jgi:hypothetical protein